MSDWDLEALRDPPRALALPTWVALVFGGSLSLVGWALVAGGAMAVLAFADPVAMQDDLVLDRGEHVVMGEVTQSFWTDADETLVWARYAVGEEEHKVKSWTPGAKLKKGTPVEVVFVPGRPSVARIGGMHSMNQPWWPLGLLVVPAAGFAVVGAAAARGLGETRLLKRGLLARGELVSKQPLSLDANNRTLYDLTFQFVDRDGASHQATVRTAYTDALEDDEREPLLYRPGAPTAAVLLDSFRLKLVPRPDGKVHLANPAAATVAMAPAALAVMLVSLTLFVRLVSL